MHFTATQRVHEGKALKVSITAYTRLYVSLDVPLPTSHYPRNSPISVASYLAAGTNQQILILKSVSPKLVVCSCKRGVAVYNTKHFVGLQTKCF